MNRKTKATALSSLREMLCSGSKRHTWAVHRKQEMARCPELQVEEGVDSPSVGLEVAGNNLLGLPAVLADPSLVQATNKGNGLCERAHFLSEIGKHEL